MDAMHRLGILFGYVLGGLAVVAIYLILLRFFGKYLGKVLKYFSVAFLPLYLLFASVEWVVTGNSQSDFSAKFFEYGFVFIVVGVMSLFVTALVGGNED